MNTLNDIFLILALISFLQHYIKSDSFSNFIVRLITSGVLLGVVYIPLHFIIKFW